MLTEDRAPRLRCAVPVWRFSFEEVAANARAPYPLRLLAPWSQTAKRLVVAFDRLGFARPRSAWTNAQLERLADICRAMVDLAASRHVPLRFIVLPVKSEVCGTDEGREVELAPRALFLQAVARAGAPVDDAAPAFTGAADKTSLFQAAVGDPHFSTAGHAFYASLVGGILDGWRSSSADAGAVPR